MFQQYNLFYQNQQLSPYGLQKPIEQIPPLSSFGYLNKSVGPFAFQRAGTTMSTLFPKFDANLMGNSGDRDLMKFYYLPNSIDMSRRLMENRISQQELPDTASVSPNVDKLVDSERISKMPFANYNSLNLESPTNKQSSSISIPERKRSRSVDSTEKVNSGLGESSTKQQKVLDSDKTCPNSCSSSEEYDPISRKFLCKLKGLPMEFIETIGKLTQHEERHWKLIVPQVEKAGRKSSILPDSLKWRAWVEITAELPLNNGGPLRRVLDIALFYLRKYNANSKILDDILEALGPAYYKSNAVGTCRRRLFEILRYDSQMRAEAQKNQKISQNSSPSQ